MLNLDSSLCLHLRSNLLVLEICWKVKTYIGNQTIKTSFMRVQCKNENILGTVRGQFLELFKPNSCNDMWG